MRIALVSSSELPRPDHDLPFLVKAFARRGAEAEVVCWEDRAVDWRAFDVALVRSTWNYVARFDEFLGWIDRAVKATRLVNPPEALRWNLHKRYLVELADAGIPVVPTGLVAADAQPDWRALFARHGALVVKPAISAGSFATVRIEAGDVAAAAAHRHAHRHREMLVQPLLPSVLAHGETNLVHFGGRFSHAIRKAARWDGDLEQSRDLVEPTPAERALAGEVLAFVAARGLGTPAYARIDVACSDAGEPLLMELEIVEPSLFLDRAPDGAARLVDAVVDVGGPAATFRS